MLTDFRYLEVLQQQGRVDVRLVHHAELAVRVNLVHCVALEGLGERRGHVGVIVQVVEASDEVKL